MRPRTSTAAARSMSMRPRSNRNASILVLQTSPARTHRSPYGRISLKNWRLQPRIWRPMLICRPRLQISNRTQATAASTSPTTSTPLGLRASRGKWSTRRCSSLRPKPHAPLPTASCALYHLSIMRPQKARSSCRHTKGRIHSTGFRQLLTLT